MVLFIAFVIPTSSVDAKVFNWITQNNKTSYIATPDSPLTRLYENVKGIRSVEDEEAEISIDRASKVQTKTHTAISLDISKNPILVLEGEASFYSWDGCLGCNPLRIMANGKVLNDNALTMAIGANRKHLVGRQARVTNLASGKSTVVLITDTGGFYQTRYNSRVADLTIGTKQAIGMDGGLAWVRVEVF